MTACLRVLATLVVFPLASAGFAEDETVPIGVARIDITPDSPIRLTGYASRKTESEGVALRLWAKALAIGGDAGEGPAVLMMVENCGVPASLAAEVAGRLEAKARVAPQRVVICSTHTHAGPWLTGFAKALLSDSLPPEHRSHMERYERQLVDKMEQVALAALAARRPGRLAWGEGLVRFAMNRRPINKDGKCPGLGVNPGGPTDHSLPLLCATDAAGKIMAIVVNYACHCTTIGGDFNRIHGDWAGMAQEYIEAEHPGATALVCIGCGADANPEPRGKAEMTGPHGRAVADEVNRLLRGKLIPVCPKLAARRLEFSLPFDKLPTRQELEARAAAAHQPKTTSAQKAFARQAADSLAELDHGRPLPAGIDYSVTAWSFGNDLAMVFLPGEVVVDYALRLKRELDGARLWVTAYANDVPCYIVSRRVLAEGGYEPDYSMIYYGRPTRLSPAVEDKIVNAAKSLLPKSFAACRAGSAGPGAWRAGVAAVRVTPQTSLWMSGYGGRTRPSEGITQDLFAKALALEDARSDRAVIVTLDLIGMDRPMRDWLEKQVHARYGLKPAELLLNTSHTHCGPEFCIEDLPPKIDPALVAAAEKYRGELQEKVAVLVGDALARLAPAQLDYLHARCGFAMNQHGR